MPQLNIDYFHQQTERHEENAASALRRLISEATEVLEALEHGDAPRRSVGGSTLNGQTFLDAERSLALYAAAADTQRVIERTQTAA
jgi:NTP pyrophosphatase (non-canonical NTP hydrolase)